jgi:DNA-binding beta-propeller fold protein YncE
MSRVRSLPAPAQPEAINVTPSGDRVFAGSNATGRVTVFDTEDGSSRTIAEGFGWPYRMFLTPGVGQLIVPDMGGEVLRFFDGESYEELGSIDFAGQAPQGLALHADGRHLFLSLSGANRIAVVDIEDRSVVGYLPAGSSPDGIAYSPVVVSR